MSESSIPWPGNNDQVFSGGDYDQTLACLDWIKRGTSNYLLAGAFKKSADIIVSHIEAGRTPEHPDAYFFPVTYLYRHAIELNLKELIRFGINHDVLKENCRLKLLMNSHKLYSLWNKVKDMLLKISPDGNKADLRNMERLIQEFHNLDPTGQNLRYSRTIQGDSTTDNFPDIVDLVKMRNTCAGLFCFFDGCDAFLDAMDPGSL